MAVLILPTVAELQPGKPLKSDIMTKIRQAILDVNTSLEGFGIPNSFFPAGFTGDGSDGARDDAVSASPILDGQQFTSWIIRDGVVLTPADGIMRVGVTGTFTMGEGASGILDLDGNGHAGGAGVGAGNPGIAGTALSTRLGIGAPTAAGGGSGNTQPGGAGGGVLSQAGGAGGTGFLGAGGAGLAALGSASQVAWWVDPSNLHRSPGGGSGGNQGGGTSGAGGTGSGVIWIECNEFIFNAGATIRARGLAGGNAAVGNVGGGGGGAGGLILVFTRLFTTNSGTVSVAGGAAGIGISAGGNGGLGGSGRSVLLEVA